MLIESVLLICPIHVLQFPPVANKSGWLFVRCALAVAVNYEFHDFAQYRVVIRKLGNAI